MISATQILLALACFLAGWLIFLVLRKDPLAQFDTPLGQPLLLDNKADQVTSDKALEHINQRLRSSRANNTSLSLHQRVPIIRQVMEEFFAADEKNCVSHFTPVKAGNVSAEWVVAPNVDSTNNRRLLYIHGGAFFAGSPKSHRVITSKLSEISGCSVLSIDYRLMPEHSRMAGVDDCREAYQWLLDNGPQGPKPASTLFVAGDSAGGNLTLSLLAWARDAGHRAPNAAVAFSPVTDLRMQSPSIRDNLQSDIMLKPLAHRIAKLPRAVLSISARLLARHNTKDPVVSPLLGDLSGLPAILVLASEQEILRDDGRRYVNKAVAAGTDATLICGQNMPHVWPIFYPHLPEARLAFDRIEAFFTQHA